jgi:hypothetical protein
MLVFLFLWAISAGVGGFITWGNVDNLDNRWGKVFGYSFLFACVIQTIISF